MNNEAGLFPAVGDIVHFIDDHAAHAPAIVLHIRGDHPRRLWLRVLGIGHADYERHWVEHGDDDARGLAEDAARPAGPERGGTEASMSIRILVGDCRDVLKTLPDESVNCVVTSPPYFGLRSYLPDGHPDKAREIGAEPTLAAYIETLTGVFREVRRVLRSDGTCWLNCGDSYASAWPCSRRNIIGSGSLANGKRENRPPRLPDGLKEKDLMMVPARLALALQSDGWWLRSDIIWHKKAPMPESVTDRPTQAHEHVFLLTKSAKYWYDADAVREPHRHQDLELLATNAQARQQARLVERRAFRTQESYRAAQRGERVKGRGQAGNQESMLAVNPAGRNLRSVWTLGPDPYPGNHYAVFPKELARRCILAGCPEGGVVLDPFGGSGTVGLVADRLNRDAVLIELNPEYSLMAERRIRDDAPMFADVEALA